MRLAKLLNDRNTELNRPKLTNMSHFYQWESAVTEFHDGYAPIYDADRSKPLDKIWDEMEQDFLQHLKERNISFDEVLS